MQIADLLQRAKAIGQAHASDEAQESSAWGGSFVDAFASAQQIISNFVQRIADWIAGQDPADLTEEDIEAEVEDVAGHVGDYEIAAAIEQAVVDELIAAGEDMLQSYAQPGACANCLAIASAGPTPASEFVPGPYHNGCRCTSGPPGG